ncbi:MAG: hypothetical protein AAF598_04315 [Bacteroidota bacterium]
MSQKDKTTAEEPTANNPVSGVEAIREILMGGHIANYASTFDDIRTSIKDQGSDTQQALADLEKKMETHFQQLTDSIDKRLTALTKDMEKKVGDLQKRIDEVSANDKQKMSKLLAMMSQNLIND